MGGIADLTSLPAPPFWETEWKPSPTLLPMFAVGWLAATVPRQGTTPEAVIDRLVAAHVAGEYFGDHSLGWHTCEICATPAHRPKHTWRDSEVETCGHGFHLIEHDGRAFVAPRLLLHYVLAHRYRPPEDFLDAVVKGRFLKPAALTPDGVAAIQRVRREMAPRPPWRRELARWIFVALFTAAAVGVWRLLAALPRC